MPARPSVIVGRFRMGLGLGGFLTPLSVLFLCRAGRRRAYGWAPALVPASPSIKATAAKQKHDDDND
jgi:hypothetical protein